MAYKKIERYISFADIAIQKHADKNRSLAFLKQLNNMVDWAEINKLLLQFYKTGKKDEGGKAYPPLLLFKVFLQKWFHPVKWSSNLTA